MEKWLAEILDHPTMRAYATCEGATYQCYSASVRAKELLDRNLIENPYSLEDVKLVNVARNKFKLDSGLYSNGCMDHVIVKIGNFYYDFTIRQMLQSYPLPVAIYTESEIKEAWENVHVNN